jgi:hypothetical protein
VWLRITAATMTRRYGSVVAVFPSAVHDDAELGVRFDDGAYTTVRASQRESCGTWQTSAISASQEACQV